MSEENKSGEPDKGPVNFFNGKKNEKDLFVWIPPTYKDTLELANKLGLRRLPNSSNWQVPFLKREQNVTRITEAAKAEAAVMAARRASGEHLKGRDMERLKQLDAGRIPVLEGTDIGAKAEAAGRSFEVAHMSRSFELNVHEAADMNERFGTDFKEGDKVAYAYDTVPERELERRQQAEENKQKNAEAGRDRALKRDEGRALIASGSSEIGEGIEQGDKSFEIAHIGDEFEVTEKSAEDLNARFGTSFAAGDKVAYAYEEVPASVLAAREKEAEEDSSPSGP